MVTIRLKIRTGVLGGSLVEVSVTRPTLPLALAATTWTLIGRRALAFADLLSALRSERGVASASPTERVRTPGDPFGLSVPRQPHVTVSEWGLAPVIRHVAAAWSKASAELAKALPPSLGSIPRPTAPPSVKMPDLSPLKPLDLSAFGKRSRPPEDDQPE
jgi:hypothetical protein